MAYNYQPSGNADYARPAKNNAVVKKQSDACVEYTSGGEKVKLSPGIVRRYLVNGGGNVTDQEVIMFLMLCKAQHLNPFLRDAYLIKYGSNPATIVTGKGTFLKRASNNPHYDGKESGIIVIDPETGTVTERSGCFYVPGEEIIGGWAKVYTKNRSKPEYVTVPFEEYVGRKKDGSLNSQWANKPATMIQKVAVVQALREAFPEDFAGLYSPEEVAEVSDVYLDEAPIEMTDSEQPAPQQQSIPSISDQQETTAACTDGDPAKSLFGADYGGQQ